MGLNRAAPRVAFYLPSLRGGGAERVTVVIANGILNRGYAVDMVLARAIGPYLSDLNPNIRVVDLESRGVLASLPTFARYLHREGPRTLMSNMWHANIVAVRARWLSGSKARLVVRESSTPSLNLAQYPSWQRWGYLCLIRSHYRMADALIAPSQGVASDLHQCVGLPLGSITIVPNPVVHIGLVEKAHAPLSHPWFVEGALPVVISVGRLAPEKDFSTLIRAFARVKAEHPSRLLILGDGSERRILDGLVQELGIGDSVSLPGFTDNPWSYMARARAYVLSSRFEGSPGALIEAMAVGCPVVATDCPSGPREILKQGKYGRLVPVGDIEALSLAILETLRQPRDPYPEEALAPFRLERVLDTYERLLVGLKCNQDWRVDDVRHYS